MFLEYNNKSWNLWDSYMDKTKNIDERISWDTFNKLHESLR